MITTTLNDLCAAIYITSDLADWSTATTALSIKMEIQQNCCEKITSYTLTDFITLDSFLIDIDGVRYLQLVPDFLGMSDTLTDGVYSITVTTRNADESLIKESACILVDCFLRCKVAQDIAKGDYESAKLLEAIHSANSCQGVDCDCTTACDLLTMLLEKLDLQNSKDDDIPDCGCS